MIVNSAYPSAAVRIRVMKRDRFQCTYCGVPGTDAELEIDHIVPKAKGGSNHMSNLTTACRKCNQSKSDGVAPVAQSGNENPLVGMGVHILKDGKILKQARCVAVHGSVVFLQLFSWLDGEGTNIEALPVDRVTDPEQCLLYENMQAANQYYETAPRWRIFC